MGGADAQRVEGELMSYDLVPESAGGDTLVARVSAKEKTGLDELLEKVLLQADLLDLKANPDRPATGTVIEAGVEKGSGFAPRRLSSEVLSRWATCLPRARPGGNAEPCKMNLAIR